MAGWSGCSSPAIRREVHVSQAQTVAVHHPRTGRGAPDARVSDRRLRAPRGSRLHARDTPLGISSLVLEIGTVRFKSLELVRAILSFVFPSENLTPAPVILSGMSTSS